MFKDITVKQSSGFTSEQAATVDYLINANYRVNIPNCPILSQTITKCSIPKIAIGSAKQMTPQVSIPHIGDGIVVGSFIVEFPILSDLSNYMEVYSWIYRMLADDLIDKRQAEVIRQIGVATTTRTSNNKLDISEFYVDSSVILYDRNNNPSCTIDFYGMVPVDLSAIDLNALSTSQDPVNASVTFKYIMHKITPTTK